MNNLRVLVAMAREFSTPELAVLIGGVVAVLVEREGKEKAAAMLRSAADAIEKPQ